MKEITLSEFNESVTSKTTPVIVDFFAPWCGPCRVITPILSDLSEKYGIEVVKIDIDKEENYDLVSAMAIRSVPTLRVWNGKEFDETVVGAPPRDKLVSMFERLQ